MASQPYATKIRNCTESFWKWHGQLNLYPEFDHHRDEELIPAVNIELDMATPWEEFAQTPFAMTFGDWRTTASQTDVIGRNTNNFGAGITTTTTTRTTSTQQRTNQGLQVDVTSREYNLGSFVKDVSSNPYIRSRVIAFAVTGLKPNSRYYTFFDKVNVSEHSAPGELSGQNDFLQGQENQIINRTGDYGDDIVSDASGNVYGVFRIPQNEFRVGDREFIIANVDNIVTSPEAATSSAKAIYTASNLAVTSQNIDITTREPSISTATNIETNTTTSINSRSTTTWFPPPQNNFNIQNEDSGDEGGRDPLAHSFLTVSPGSPTLFIPQIGLYFRDKDETLGMNVYLMEMSYNFPDSSKIIAKAHLKASDINTSTDASVETIFTFENIVPLASNKYYCYQVKPDGNSPNYTIWMSAIGQNDINTGQQVFSNPYMGVTFISANEMTYTPIQTEDPKVNIYRAVFTTGTGSAYFENEDDDYFTVDGINRANSSISPLPGDIVYTANSTAVAQTGNTDPVGYIQLVDDANDKLILDLSSGGFSANDDIQIHRPFMNNQSVINANTLVATATIDSVDNEQYSMVVPRFATLSPSFTSLTFGFKGTDTSYNIDGTFETVTEETENEFFDKMRIAVSKSNEETEMSGNKSSTYKIDLNTGNDYVSPMIDMVRKSSYHIENIINNDNTNEHTRYGNALTKYISPQITLKDGQDAEDIQIYIGGYKPPTTEIEVYVKFLNGEDGESIDDKVWTKLNYTSGETLFSSTANPQDFREFVYGVPSTAPVTNGAFLNENNFNIIEYQDTSDGIFVGFKSFMVKVVLLSESKLIVPRLTDARAICLQV
jgi:hypothetical protein